LVACTNKGVANAVPIFPETVVRFAVVPATLPEPVMLPLPLVMILIVLPAPVAARGTLITILPLETPRVLLSTIDIVPAAESPLPTKVIKPVPR